MKDVGETLVECIRIKAKGIEELALKVRKEVVKESQRERYFLCAPLYRVRESPKLTGVMVLN